MLLTKQLTVLVYRDEILKQNGRMKIYFPFKKCNLLIPFIKSPGKFIAQSLKKIIFVQPYKA